MLNMNTCMFCKNTSTCNIHEEYNDRGYTVKHDMLKFFGHQIEDYLRDDDAVCMSCMTMMNHVARLKCALLPLIYRSENHKCLKFGRRWKIFSSIDFEEDAAFFRSARTSSSNSFVKFKVAVPYEHHMEMKMAQIESNRSYSRTSDARSESNSEITKALSRTRKRKRGNNWVRRKNGRYSRTNTETPATTYSRSVISTPQSHSSTESYETFYPPCIESTPIPTVTTPMHLTNKTFPSRSPDQVDLGIQEDESYLCPEGGCTFICEDIDDLTKHKTERHKQLASFFCKTCEKKFASQDDLDIHKDVHSEQYFCEICHREFYFKADLLEHWNEYVRKSVPCKYCGKRFVDDKMTERHQRKVHEQRGPSRFDYKCGTENTKSTCKNGFEIRILGVNLNNNDMQQM